MIRRFRRRFIALNMLLVGLVLLLSMVGHEVYEQRNRREELKNAMHMVLSSLEHRESGARPPEKKDAPSEAAPDSPSPGQDASDHSRPAGTAQRTSSKAPERRWIAAALYNRDTDSVTISTHDSLIEDEAVERAVREAEAQPRGFGVLPSEKMFYYRTSSGGEQRVAVASENYLSIQLRGDLPFLLGIFAAAMTAVFLISLALSSMAVKPMKDALDMEQRFIADVSHDLKTPIAVILANTTILEADGESTARGRQRWLESTRAAAESMETLVGEMLSLAELADRERPVLRTRVDLSAAAEKAALQLEPLAFERGIHLEQDLQPDVVILGTEDYVERICMSLLENAVKYEPRGGQVDLSVRCDGAQASLLVRNHGSAIAPEDLPHIFERFYRGDKARSSRTGHGLGLPAVQRLTELLGAEVSVSSQEGGAAFTVRFDTAFKSK